MKDCWHTKTSRGMTLIETLVVLGIYTILSLAITSGIAQFYTFNSYTLEQADEVENGRRGMTQWGRDAKEITNGENGAYPIAVIDEHTFAYYSDTDLDNSVEYVEYILATTTLRKYTYNATGTPSNYNFSTPDTAEVLSLYVRNIEQGTSTFRYFDNSGNLLSSSSPVVDVRYIQAQFIINIDPVRSPGEFLLRSSISPRNLKDNL
jgi:prepilin-type N-terminal cleavage/methylation domain-containing protein